MSEDNVGCDRNLLQETCRIINWRLLIYYIKYSEVGHLTNDRKSSLFHHSKQNKFHDFVFPEQQTKAFSFLLWSKNVFIVFFGSKSAGVARKHLQQTEASIIPSWRERSRSSLPRRFIWPCDWKAFMQQSIATYKLLQRKIL